MTDLFTPIRFGAIDLPNRVVMAPMTRNRAGSGNIPQDLNAHYYEQRATAGLIITEGAQISPQGVGYPATPGIHNAEQVEGWKQVTDRVHAGGGHIFIQLWHVGRISHPSLQPNDALPVAPSAIAPKGEAVTYDGMKPFVTPRALATDEMPGIVAQYRQAAEQAIQAGFDGVEIHAANGYLLDQFIRDGSNHRTDRYGGSLENRVRLLMEVTEAVAGATGNDRVGVRISPVNAFNDMHDSDPQHTFSYMAERLSELQPLYLHVMETSIASDAAGTCDMRQIRERFDGLYIANGGYDRDRANQSLADGSADLVAFGIPFLANPDLPERLRRDAPLNEADSATFYGGDAHGYTDYPSLGDSA